MFRAQNHVTLALIKIALNRQTGVYFQCHLFISNGIYQVHMKLLILDQLQWVNFAACTQRPVMITGEVSHGIPFIKPI